MQLSVSSIRFEDSRLGMGAGGGHSCPSSKGKLQRAAVPLIARAAESYALAASSAVSKVPNHLQTCSVNSIRRIVLECVHLTAKVLLIDRLSNLHCEATFQTRCSTEIGKVNAWCCTTSHCRGSQPGNQLRLCMSSVVTPTHEMPCCTLYVHHASSDSKCTTMV